MENEKNEIVTTENEEATSVAEIDDSGSGVAIAALLGLGIVGGIALSRIGRKLAAKIKNRRRDDDIVDSKIVTEEDVETDYRETTDDEKTE